MGCSVSKNNVVGPHENRTQSEQPASMTAQESLLANNIVEQHNIYRRQHNVCDLTLNHALCDTSRRWAQHLAQIKKMKNSDVSYRSYKGEPLGENLVWLQSADVSSIGEVAVKNWYDEITKYDYEEAKYQKQAGHFTQVVWRNTTDVGVGVAFDQAGQSVYIVCHYFPAGNVPHEFRQNVLQPLTRHSDGINT